MGKGGRGRGKVAPVGVQQLSGALAMKPRNGLEALWHEFPQLCWAAVLLFLRVIAVRFPGLEYKQAASCFICPTYLLFQVTLLAVFFAIAVTHFTPPPTASGPYMGRVCLYLGVTFLTAFGKGAFERYKTFSDTGGGFWAVLRDSCFGSGTRARDDQKPHVAVWATALQWLAAILCSTCFVASLIVIYLANPKQHTPPRPHDPRGDQVLLYSSGAILTACWLRVDCLKEAVPSP